MLTTDFDYELPPELIAQSPAEQRDMCRLLEMERLTGELHDHIFRDILDLLEPGDILVANETRVMPARLLGKKRDTGGEAEVFLLREVFDREPKTSHSGIWEVLVRPGKRLKPGAAVEFCDENGNVALTADILDWAAGVQRGERVARLSTTLPSLDEALHAVGNTPLPPYIHNYTGDKELYQTVYSRRESSAAAPTAGLHFTPELIAALQAKGIGWHTVELEVGLDTFRIVDESTAEAHVIHTEYFHVPAETVAAVEAAHAAGHRVIAVGTTATRSLESAAWPAGFWNPAEVKRYYTHGDHAGGCALRAVEREATSLYILPGYEFRVIDGLITNFHVPKSTLMMLVSAMSSRDNIMAAYAHAIAQRYRFFSFGDAMLIH